MADATQAILTATIPTLAVLIGILVNNSRLSDLRSDMNRRFDDINRRIEDMNRRIEDTRDLLRAEFIRVEQVLDARVKHLEENR
jgi:hypothetical protein